MYAIASIKGSQYQIAEGDIVQVALLKDKKEGDKLSFYDILVIAKGDDVKVGVPYIDGAAIEAKVLGHGKGDKVRVVKYKKRKRYLKTQGHRQNYTEIEISKIHESGKKRVEELLPQLLHHQYREHQL